LIFARSESDLESQISESILDEPVVVQREIRGFTGSTSVLYDAGRPVCWFAYLMRETWPNRFSSACTIQMHWRADLEKMAAELGRLTVFSGLCGIDWMLREGEEQVLFLEFNPRPTPVYHLGCKAGVDFSAALAAIRENTCVIPQNPNRSSAVIHLFPQGLYRAVEARNPAQFLRSLGDAPWSELALTASHLRRVITHQLPKPIKSMLHSIR
jgi:hypothetical protein